MGYATTPLGVPAQRQLHFPMVDNYIAPSMTSVEGRPTAPRDLPHGLNVLRCPTPIAPDVKVAQAKSLVAAVCDAVGCGHDLRVTKRAGLRGDSWWNRSPESKQETVGLAIVRHGPAAGGLSDPVGASRPKRHQLGGAARRRVAKAVARARVVEARRLEGWVAVDGFIRVKTMELSAFAQKVRRGVFRPRSDLQDLGSGTLPLDRADETRSYSRSTRVGSS